MTDCTACRVGFGDHSCSPCQKDFTILQKDNEILEIDLEELSRKYHERIKICDSLQQRLEDVNIKDSAKTREINILTVENRQLRIELAKECKEHAEDYDRWVDTEEKLTHSQRENAALLEANQKVQYEANCYGSLANQHGKTIDAMQRRMNEAVKLLTRLRNWTDPHDLQQELDAFLATQIKEN